MTEIRTKDKLFLAVVVPLAAIVAYVYCWRIDTAKRVEMLSASSVRLVKPEDFDYEKHLAERALKQAEETLAAEKQVPMPALKVKADAKASAAEREREVLAIFREAGLRVLDSELCEGGSGAAVLQATGTRPEPVSRRYRLDGRYPQVRQALETFATREMAVIVEKLDMEEAERGRWKLEVCL